MNHSLLGDPLTYRQALFAAAVACFFWMLTIPVVAALAEHFPFSSEAWPRNLPVHLVFATLFVLTYVLWRIGLDLALTSMRRLSGPLPRVFRIYLFGSMGRSLLLYIGVVALAHAWRYYRGLQAERQVSSRLQEQIAELLRDDGPPSSTASPYAERLILKERGRIFAVQVPNLDWIEASGNYVSLHVGGKTHLLRETMRSMEQKLDPAKFIRIHRSAIVQISRIREVRTIGGGRYAVVLANGTQIPLGQPGVERLNLFLPQSSPARSL